MLADIGWSIVINGIRFLFLQFVSSFSSDMNVQSLAATILMLWLNRHHLCLSN